MELGNTVHWTGDEKHNNVTGEVINFKGSYVEIRDADGCEHGIDKEYGTFKVINSRTVKAKTVEKKAVKVKAGSKKELAIELYKRMMSHNDGQHPARASVIEMFMEEFDMTKAGASTYQNTVKKLV